MAGNRTTVALEVDGEETLVLQSDAPGVLLGRGGQSSTFLRKYLTDATISREHVRVQAIADNDDGGGDGGSERDTAAAPSRVRVSVVGSNPVLLVRRKPPGGKSYIHRGQSAVAEVGDGFRFCRGFDKVVRVVTVPQPPPPVSSSRQERAGSPEEGNSGDDDERARQPTPSSSDARGVGGRAREDGNRPDGGLAGGAAIAERERRGGGESESESGVRLGDGQASAAAAAAGASRCAAEGAAAAVAPAATVVISAVKASAGTGERGDSPEKPATDSDKAGSDRPSRDSGQSTTGRWAGGDADGDGAPGKLSGGQVKRSVEGRDENAAGRSDDGEEVGKLNHEEDGSGGASGFAVMAGNVSEGGGARETRAPMQEEEEEEEEEGDGRNRQDGGSRRRRGEKEHHQRRRRQRQGVDKQGDGAQGSPPPPPLVAASTETALASRSRDGVASSSPAAAAAAATLRVALVGRGFSKNQQEVFRKNGSKVGIEVLVRPESKVEKPPNLFEATPGATPGKGKKRRRSNGNERHHRKSQPPPPPPPPPPSPPRQFVACGGGGGSGGGGLLEQLRRERFAVAVCWSEEVAPWAELLGPTAAEGGAEVPPPVGAGMGLGGGGGGGGGVGGEDVEVVGHQWLVSCLQQNRRVDTRPYLLSPLKKNDVVGAEEEGEEEGGGAPAFVVPMYACQRPTPMKHHNHEITDVLDAMTKMYKVVGDGQRADSFMRLSSVLRFLDRTIRSGSEIRHVHHVGERMVEAVDEILATGTLGRLEELKSHPRNQVCQQLMKVHGVGSRTAKDWYNRGIRSVEDARRTLLPNDDDTEGDEKRPNLKPEVVMGLKHFHDMQVPIGRDEVVGIADEVREEAERFGRERDPEGTLLFEVCGGFRRGKETLHDVDVLVSFRRGNGEPGHQGFVEGLKERLMERGKLCATLYQGQMGGFTKAKGGQAPQPKLEREEVLMALWQLPGRKCRIDIVQVASSQWPFALLGWSGTVMFEKDVRRYTEEQTEYKLSQKGVTIRATDEPVTDIVSFQTEEDIFRFLGLEYIPPHLRWV